MKFITKKEYQRMIDTRSNYLGMRRMVASHDYKVEEANYSFWDKIKIKLGLLPGNKIKVRTTSKFFRDRLKEWLKLPAIYRNPFASRRVKDEASGGYYREYNILVNKFDDDEMPNPVKSKDYHEHDFNIVAEDSFRIRKQWQKQVWIDRLIRFILLVSLFFSVNFINNPFPNVIWVWVVSLFSTMLISKLIKFVILDPIKGGDFLFWKKIYVDKREWHYVFRYIIVFVLAYIYLSLHMLWISNFNYSKLISAFIVYIIGNHIWFKYETDPDKKALK